MIQETLQTFEDLQYGAGELVMGLTAVALFLQFLEIQEGAPLTDVFSSTRRTFQSQRGCVRNTIIGVYTLVLAKFLL